MRVLCTCELCTCERFTVRTLCTCERVHSASTLSASTSPCEHVTMRTHHHASTLTVRVRSPCRAGKGWWSTAGRSLWWWWLSCLCGGVGGSLWGGPSLDGSLVLSRWGGMVQGGRWRTVGLAQGGVARWGCRHSVVRGYVFVPCCGGEPAACGHWCHTVTL